MCVHICNEVFSRSSMLMFATTVVDGPNQHIKCQFCIIYRCSWIKEWVKNTISNSIERTTKYLLVMNVIWNKKQDKTIPHKTFCYVVYRCSYLSAKSKKLSHLWNPLNFFPGQNMVLVTFQLRKKTAQNLSKSNDKEL